jgi:ketosteroid isomerase-like protein
MVSDLRISSSIPELNSAGGHARTMGKFPITGKNDKGDALDASGTWTAVYVKVEGKWKARMLTAAPNPPKKD